MRLSGTHSLRGRLCSAQRRLRHVTGGRAAYCQGSDPPNNSKVKGKPNFKNEPVKQEICKKEPMKQEHYKKEPIQVKKEPPMKQEESEDGGAVGSTMGIHDGEHVVGGRIGKVR